MLSRTTIPLFLFSCATASIQGQSNDLSVAELQRVVTASLRAFIDDYVQRDLGPRGLLREESRLQPRYVREAARGGFVGDRDLGRLTHLDVLQKLVFYGERHPSVEVADVLLDLAAVGVEGEFLDRQSRELREIGHWALMRVPDQSVWFLILRAAAGERVPLLDEAREAARRRRARLGRAGADDIALSPSLSFQCLFIFLFVFTRF